MEFQPVSDIDRKFRVDGDNLFRGEKSKMRSLHKYGTMAAAVALLAASGTVANAADVDLQSLQQQINQLQQQLKDMQAKQAAAPAPAVDPDAAKIPANGGPGFLQYGSSAGGFVIPGTKTALKIGGNMKLDVDYDLDAGHGSAGGDTYGIRAGTGSGNGFALPGTFGARQQGRLSANAGYSRINFETRTPSEYGEIKFYTEIDFSGAATGGDQYNSDSHTPRLRHIYGTVGNFLAGQTWTLWTDRATLANSVLSNGPAGVESGVRQPVVQYRWDLDAKQQNQIYLSLENPFSDFTGVDKESFFGTAYNNPTNYNSKYPDVLARYAYNDSWGRAFLTGMVRDISANTEGQTLGASSSTGLKFTGQANDSTIGWGIASGAKVYTGLGNAKNAVFVRGEVGQGISRYMNVNSSTQLPSAIFDTNGKLQSILEGGYQVAYQHFFDDKNNWQANVIWSDQKSWQKNSLMVACGVAGSVCGLNGLPTRYQNIEINFQWSPNSYVSTGPAYIRSNAEVVKGLNNYTTSGALAAGTTRGVSGTTAVDNRFQWTTQIGF